MNKLLQRILSIKPLYILIGIFLFAFILRIYKLGSIPATFQEDEILSGYVGRYILKNGIDIYGNAWPLLYFNKFGDYYIILPMYLAGVSIWLFGVTEFAVRFPIALIGSLIVFPVYYFAKLLFKQKKVGYLAALLISITPWHLVLSRSMVEGIIGSTVFLSAITLLLYGIKDKKFSRLIYAGILMFISYFTYHPFRLYVPLSFIPLFFLFGKELQDKKIKTAVIVLGIFFFILTGYISSTPWGSGRLKQTSIFSELSGVEIRIQQSIYNVGNNNVFEARLFHNKVIGYSREYIKQYLTYFSPLFLFITGGAESRYEVPDQGLLYLSFLLFLGTSIVFRKDELFFKNPTMCYLGYLILIAPAPAALTYLGAPNVHRAVFLIVLLIFPISYGFYILLSSKYRFKAIVLPVIVMILVSESIYFWHQYKSQADIYTSLRRNDGFKELSQYVISHQEEYEAVILPAEGNTALYYLFFSGDFSASYAKQFAFDAHIGKVKNIYFLKTSCPTQEAIEKKYQKVLIVDRYNCASPTNFHHKEDIKGVNPLLGFKLYTLK